MPLEADCAKFLQSANIKLLEIFGSSETSVLGTRHLYTAPFTLRPYFRKIAAGQVERTLYSGEKRIYPLQDNFIWPTEETFWPQGRLDTAIQIGGINVYPEKIVAYLSSNPKIRACTVRLDQNLGRLKAFIVLKDAKPSASLRQELRIFVKKGLTNVEQPVRFDFGDDLPKNPLGKFVDW